MKKQTKIKFGFKYFIAYIYIMLLFAIITIIGTFLLKDDKQILKILFFLLMFFCFCGFLLAALYNCQYAIIGENQIVFKSLLCTFGVVNFSEIKAIKKESLVTFKNALGNKKSCDWIVFYTEKDISTKTSLICGLNKKNKPPFMIPFNEENSIIIKQLFKTKNLVDF